MPIKTCYSVMPVACRFVLLLVLVTGPVEDAVGQSPEVWGHRAPVVQQAESDAPSLDVEVLRTVYHTEAPAFRGMMRGADRSAYPVFFGAPVVAWGHAWLVEGGDDWSGAYRLTVSQVATYGAVRGLKELFQRPRPYLTVPGIQSRSPRYSPSGPEGQSFAFPSGHASMAFAVAASLSLSHPEWYVIGPGAVWASAVALSRVWLGVHYPSDIVAGALLGTTLSVVVHLIGPSITPDALTDDATPMQGPAMQFQIRF